VTGLATWRRARRTVFEDEHEDFRASFRRFVEKEIVPNHDRWEREGRVDSGMFLEAGRQGF
jgi:alkylation response protein AidB-like acyl-CoA dehydrogenase